MFYYRGCEWDEGNSERCLKWGGGGVNRESHLKQLKRG